MKLISKLGKLFVILVITVSILLFSASLLMQEEVGGIILRSLNKNISTKLETGSFRLSFLRRFPHASLELKNVLVRSSPDFNAGEFGAINTDTLIFAKSVSMEFRITDIIKGNYTIESISARSGTAHFFTDSKWKVNYDVSSDQEKKSGAVFTLELEKIHLSDFEAVYNNLANKLIIEGLIKNGKLKSRISGDNIDFITQSDLGITFFQLYNTTITHPVAAGLDLELISSKEGVSFKKGQLTIDNFDFTLAGSISHDDVLDLRIAGHNIDLAKITHYLPEKYNSIASSYNPSGTLVAECDINGPLTRTLNPHIEIRYTLDKGRITMGKSNLSVNNISFKGSITNGKGNKSATASSKVDDLKFRFGNSEYNGTIKIQDFNKPTTEISLKGTVFPRELKEFFAIERISTASGSADIDLKLVTAWWPKDSITFNEIIDLEPVGDIIFHSFSLGLDKDKWKFSNVKGNVSVSDSYNPSNLAFEYEGQKINLTGEFTNLPQWLAGRPVALVAKADVSFDRLIPEVFIKESAAEKKTRTIKTGKEFPNDIYLDLNFSIDKLDYKTFSSSRIKGTLNYKPRLLTFKSFAMNSLNGTISGDGFIVQNNNRSIISRGNFEISGIDVNQAFTTFRNFGQDFIVAENLSGSLSGSISMLLPMDASFKPDIKAVTAEGKYNLTNGSLINFGPVKELSSFIELSELENIHFQNLENDFYIRNNIFYVPQMDVRSSAADISINGQHSFENNYQYHVKVLLSQVLSKKRRKKSSVSEFGVVKDDGLGRTALLLKVENKGEDVRVGYDLKAVSQSVKNNIKTEKQSIKTILNEEYGWYKDETSTPQPQQKKKSRFSINWSETDSVPSEKVSDENDNSIKNLFKKK
jgi:hypothetical protein